jgi:hypothetical protein
MLSTSRYHANLRSFRNGVSLSCDCKFSNETQTVTCLILTVMLEV